MQMYVDVCGRGIGNIVLMLAGFMVMSPPGSKPPVVYCDRPEDLSGIRTELFEVVTSRPEGPAAEPWWFCNLRTLLDPEVVRVMRAIVRPQVPLLEEPDAGFCIRTSDPEHDGDVAFMNATAVEAMTREMVRYRRPVVCSNDARNLERLPPCARPLEQTDPALRNVASHWAQWHALARCPVVYHGVSGPDGSATSTFAATAAAYGGGALVGVDNQGRVHAGAAYHW